MAAALVCIHTKITHTQSHPLTFVSTAFSLTANHQFESTHPATLIIHYLHTDKHIHTHMAPLDKRCCLLLPMRFNTHQRTYLSVCNCSLSEQRTL